MLNSLCVYTLSLRPAPCGSTGQLPDDASEGVLLCDSFSGNPEVTPSAFHGLIAARYLLLHVASSTHGACTFYIMYRPSTRRDGVCQC